MLDNETPAELVKDVMSAEWTTQPSIPEEETLDSMGFFTNEKDYIITKLYRKKLNNDNQFGKLKYKKLGWNPKTQKFRMLIDKDKDMEMDVSTNNNNNNNDNNDEKETDITPDIIEKYKIDSDGYIRESFDTFGIYVRSSAKNMMIANGQLLKDCHFAKAFILYVYICI